MDIDANQSISTYQPGKLYLTEILMSAWDYNSTLSHMDNISVKKFKGSR